jgi:hypothetical protein
MTRRDSGTALDPGNNGKSITGSVSNTGGSGGGSDVGGVSGDDGDVGVGGGDGRGSGFYPTSVFLFNFHC